MTELAPPPAAASMRAASGGGCEGCGCAACTAVAMCVEGCGGVAGIVGLIWVGSRREKADIDVKSSSLHPSGDPRVALPQALPYAPEALPKAPAALMLPRSRPPPPPATAGVADAAWGGGA
jgi:hypothetical protein